LCAVVAYEDPDLGRRTKGSLRTSSCYSTLDDVVHDAKPIRFTDQVRVDKERIDEILEQIRATIPEERSSRRAGYKEQEEMLAEAQREAERIIQQARERQERLISDDEVTHAGRTCRRGDHPGCPQARARDPARRRGPRRRDPQHARGQPLEVQRRRSARPRPPRGEGHTAGVVHGHDSLRRFAARS
jgi:hypothetical protein